MKFVTLAQSWVNLGFVMLNGFISLVVIQFYQPTKLHKVNKDCRNSNDASEILLFSYLLRSQQYVSAAQYLNTGYNCPLIS